MRAVQPPEAGRKHEVFLPGTGPALAVFPKDLRSGAEGELALFNRF